MDKIDKFKGEYSWLSNMASCKPFIVKGITYNSVENWYQASKTHNVGIKDKISKMNPYEVLPYSVDHKNVQLSLAKSKNSLNNDN